MYNVIQVQVCPLYANFMLNYQVLANKTLSRLQKIIEIFYYPVHLHVCIMYM